MSMTPEKRFLGLEGGMPDDRTLLALPHDGALKSGQIEGALERRVDEIARHPLSGSPEARRLMHHLELAADRLQAEIALAGKGPLHPAAARRAAARVQRSLTTPTKAAVVAPAAVTGSASGLTSDDLTEFDRVALAVLVVSGGWNATSAKRLAVIAEEFGISIADLDRVVQGLTEFLSKGDGMRGVMGEVGSHARSSLMSAPRTTRSDIAEGAVERVFERINDVLRDEVSGDTMASRVRLTVFFVLFAVSWMLVLGWLFFSGKSDESGASDAAGTVLAESSGVQKDAAAAKAGGKDGGKDDGKSGADAASVDANGKAVAPIAALAAAAKFPRPPGFSPTVTPAAVVESASAGARWISDLEQATRELAANQGRVESSADGGHAFELAAKAMSRAADAWPAAGAYRNDAVRAFGAFARAARGNVAMIKVMSTVPGGITETVVEASRANMPAWQRTWHSAFGAGCVASLALDPAQSPELAAAAREELRQRSVAIPRGETADAFGAVAIEVLAAATPRMTEQLALGTVGLDEVSRWNEAVLAAGSSPKLRIQALLALIDASLRTAGALDQPGPLVDALAFAIRSLDFTGRGADAEPVRAAIHAWITDKTIPPSRIWVFTSLLDADLGIAWYGPDLVLATNADAGARLDLAERVDKAFPRVTTTTAGEAILVDGPQMEFWTKNLATLEKLAHAEPYQRLRNAAAALALGRLLRAYEAGDAKAAKAADAAFADLAERAEKDWGISPTGQRAGIVASGSTDGEFVKAWNATRDAKGRLNVVKDLRARAAAGDLGPQDARLVAMEVLRGNQPEVRAELGRVVLDRYSNGRELLRAVLDGLADGGSGEDARIFVTSLTGTTVAGRDWISEARKAILEKLYQLEDSKEHAVDLACAEVTSNAAALAVAFGRADATTIAATRPDRALAAAADAMRAEAAKRYMAEPFPAPIDEIERTRIARRSLAQSVTQRMAAETAAMVDYAAMLVVARQPMVRSKVADLLAASRRARTASTSASDQAMADLETVARIFGTALAPKGTDRAAMVVPIDAKNEGGVL
jgi:hypothetical protein